MVASVERATAVSQRGPGDSPYQLDPAQTLKASRALLQHIQSETKRIQDAATKKNLLLDDAEDAQNDGLDSANSIWLTLTTKQHIVDKNRLKPSKISVPHSLNTVDDLRICLITADPQRAVKDIVGFPNFPESLRSRITRIIGVTKLQARYKTFESRRQLLSDHDIFLADERINIRLPRILGKVFYKSASKRPIPIRVAEAHKKTKDDPPKKRSKDDGPLDARSPVALANEIERAISCIPVSLKPGTLMATRVGLTSFEPSQLSENIAAVVKNVIEKHVVKGWRNVKSIHIKGHSTFAVPIWLADELWTESGDVLPEDSDGEGGEDADTRGQKRKRNLTTSKGPQAGSRKKGKLDEAKELNLEADKRLNKARQINLASQKAKVFGDEL